MSYARLPNSSGYWSQWPPPIYDSYDKHKPYREHAQPQHCSRFQQSTQKLYYNFRLRRRWRTILLISLLLITLFVIVSLVIVLPLLDQQATKTNDKDTVNTDGNQKQNVSLVTIAFYRGNPIWTGTSNNQLNAIHGRHRWRRDLPSDNTRKSSRDLLRETVEYLSDDIHGGKLEIQLLPYDWEAGLMSSRLTDSRQVLDFVEESYSDNYIGKPDELGQVRKRDSIEKHEPSQASAVKSYSNDAKPANPSSFVLFAPERTAYSSNDSLRVDLKETGAEMSKLSSSSIIEKVIVVAPDLSANETKEYGNTSTIVTISQDTTDAIAKIRENIDPSNNTSDTKVPEDSNKQSNEQPPSSDDSKEKPAGNGNGTKSDDPPSGNPNNGGQNSTVASTTIKSTTVKAPSTQTAQKESTIPASTIKPSRSTDATVRQESTAAASTNQVPTAQQSTIASSKATKPLTEVTHAKTVSEATAKVEPTKPSASPKSTTSVPSTITEPEYFDLTTLEDETVRPSTKQTIPSRNSTSNETTRPPTTTSHPPVDEDQITTIMPLDEESTTILLGSEESTTLEDTETETTILEVGTVTGEWEINY
ncbi:hypothetical protein DdX_12407 [Ditylenchus destructor]|uniref:Uncharacterized protein n=1 Tax=Ditylenchus destructor TaxID=166010 RepID=A0AAD4MWK2_9BILA|nr:hypothetical protein DdX_12407 [Ditylenchus destructor]